ncbi:MAG TPA: hypothetical protein VKA16_10885, partial [Burkholderiales bacterium]|nr:hypothetical protein [Burkholderiales bacterium]
LGPAAERHKQEHRRLLEELESQADALEGRSMSLTMRYLNFWLLHHIETTDKRQAERLIEAGLGAGTAGVDQASDLEPERANGDRPAKQLAKDVARWHQAVRRGLWVAPEPHAAARASVHQPAPKHLH